MEAMQMLGGNGYINGRFDSFLLTSPDHCTYIAEYPTGRFLRDARLYTVGAGTQEIRRMLIGREFNEEFKRRSV